MTFKECLIGDGAKLCRTEFGHPCSKGTSMFISRTFQDFQSNSLNSVDPYRHLVVISPDCQLQTLATLLARTGLDPFLPSKRI